MEPIAAACKLFRRLGGVLYGCAELDLKAACVQPPPEATQQCSEAEFVESYRHLIDFVLSQKRGPVRHELFPGVPGPRRTLRADVGQIYKSVMTTPYIEVHARQMWHAIRIFHRVVHLSVSSEALAEHVGSVLRWIECRSHHHKSLGRFIWGARLRLAALKGVGVEAAVLATALTAHFKCKTPAGWHFNLRKERQGISSKTRCGAALSRAGMRRRAAATSRPSWHTRLLQDHKTR